MLQPLYWREKKKKSCSGRWLGHVGLCACAWGGGVGVQTGNRGSWGPDTALLAHLMGTLHRDREGQASQPNSPSAIAPVTECCRGFPGSNQPQFSRLRYEITHCGFPCFLKADSSGSPGLSILIPCKAVSSSRTETVSPLLCPESWFPAQLCKDKL